MSQSVTYRQNAAECYEAARIFSDSRQKAKIACDGAVMDIAGRPSRREKPLPRFGKGL